MNKTILFLCTGNYYRSRFAEILFNSMAAKKGLAWQASSRGLLALERGINVGPISAAAIRGLAARGIRDDEACKRYPALVTAAELQAATAIVALKQAEHLPLLQEGYPGFAERVEFWHVDDVPQAVAEIEVRVAELVSRLSEGGKDVAQSRPSCPSGS
jgi:protein-tyrosine phosphatase